MHDSPVPESMSVPLTSLVSIAVEQWRLANALASGGGGAPARHALRRIEDFLLRCELRVETLDGKPFDPGLAAQVIDSVEDPTLPQGQVLIDETLSPMVLWRGRVVKAAEVATRKGTGK